MKPPKTDEFRTDFNFLPNKVKTGPNEKNLQSRPPLKLKKLFGSSLYYGVAFAKKQQQKNFMGCSKFAKI